MVFGDALNFNLPKLTDKEWEEYGRTGKLPSEIKQSILKPEEYGSYKWNGEKYIKMSTENKHNKIEYDFLESAMKCPLLKDLYSNIYINKEIKNKGGSMTFCELDLVMFQILPGNTYRADVFEIKSGNSMKAMYKATSQMYNVSKHWNDIYRTLG